MTKIANVMPKIILVDVYLFFSFLFRDRKRGSGERERHHSVAPPIYAFIGSFFKIDFEGKKKGGRERGREREKEILICFTYLCIHWLVFVCAMTSDWNWQPWLSG